MDQCDDGKDDTILSFPIPEQEGFIAMSASLQDPSKEEKDLNQKTSPYEQSFYTLPQISSKCISREKGVA